MDALTVASVNMPVNIHWARGADAIFDAAGCGRSGTSVDWVRLFSENDFLSPPARRASDAFIERLSMLMLDIIREPTGMDELLLGGVAFALSVMLSATVAPMAAMLKAGLVQAGVATMRRVDLSPADWVSCRARGGILATGVLHLGWAVSTSQVPGLNKTQLLLDAGFVDLIISCLKAYESRGASKMCQANVCGIWSCMQALSSTAMDLTAPEAQPIVRQLESIPSALRFVLAHPLNHHSDLGYTTEAQCAVVCALAFGKKEEGSDFNFTPDMVDSVVRSLYMILSDEMISSFYPTLTTQFLRPVVHLCISDVNKSLLILSSDLAALLREALLLDPAHPRRAQERHIVASIQRDAVECYLQLALVDAGRAMWSADSAALQDLSSLAEGGGALMEETQVSARQVLLALKGLGLRERQAGTSRQVGRDTGLGDSGGHLMLSYRPCHNFMITIEYK